MMNNQKDGSVTMSTIFHAEAVLEYGSGLQYRWHENDPTEYLTTYAFVGPPNHKHNRGWNPGGAFLHCYFRCERPHVPAVVAAQLMERILRGCLLFAHTVFRVRSFSRIELQEVAEPGHPFFGVDTGILDAEPQQFILQPETEGTTQLVGAGPFISKELSIDGVLGNPRSRIAAFVSSYQQISTRTRRLIELYIRGETLVNHNFHEEAFLNFHKVYESFRHLLQERFPLKFARLRHIKSKAAKQRERAKEIAGIVGLSVTHNEDYQEKLNQIELHRDQIAAHWNFREDDDGWSLPFNAVAVASWLAHRIVLWEIEQELGAL